MDHWLPRTAPDPTRLDELEIHLYRRVAQHDRLAHGVPVNDTIPDGHVLVGDCLDLLPTLSAGLVDLIFADPPYNLQIQQPLWRPNMTKVDAVADDWDRFENFAAYDDFTQSWLAACRRVLKDTGTLWVIGAYHNIYRVGAILMDLGYWLLNDIVWIKTNPAPNFEGTRFTNAHETLIWAQKTRGGRYTFNYQLMKRRNGGVQMRSDWRLPVCTGAERLKLDGGKAHPTQKPEALLERVILASSRPGDLILDPFFGAGTTGAVARRLGRRWIGIERDATYAALARQRVASVQPAPPDKDIPDAGTRARRVPVARLIELSLLRPGQILYLGGQGDSGAVVQPDGSLRHGDLTGSIHAVARALRQAPVNGWQQWHYADAASGGRQPIDRLRAIARERDGADA